MQLFKYNYFRFKNNFYPEELRANYQGIIIEQCRFAFWILSGIITFNKIIGVKTLKSLK